ncbi:exonuclease [Caloranaerobacter sp. TR13]|uniref:exonuclease SbcCD subunit D n=1 Tax=Caloranaerobacter sp. TR13 TaxID=1302151 RepID=UPI0006D4331E|nr:exonuclease SbcCD subunit D [Caloranaerobacter sp. TR13]KPU27899.1 exonuclease [Caloranaerobacter sp. TR13]
MRILHTSDWHLGKYLENYSRLDEQEKFIDDLVGIVNEKEVDLIIIAGDIYDNSNPPARAEKLFYDALKRLSRGGERIVLVIAGNHDSPERLIAANSLATEQGIILLGKPNSTVETGIVGKHKVVNSCEGCLELEIKGEKIVIITLPYPSEQRLNEVLGDMLDENEIQKSYSNKVGEIFENLSKYFRDDTINIAASHIFVAGGDTSDSERPIQLGGGLTVDIDKLPFKAQYIALGHLHKPQKVKSKKIKAYYSGSPIQYSRSEIGYSKCVYIIDVKPKQKPNIEEVYLKNYKPIEVWKVNGIEEAIKKCEENKDREVWAYLEIVTDKVISKTEIREIKKIKPDILSIIPIIKDKVEVIEEFEDYSERNIVELFTEFYIREKDVEPSEDLIKLFTKIIYEEGDDVETYSS